MTSSSTSPRAAVIVPNYNHARYLNDTIGSITAQTLSDIEIIVVDDGSTDDSIVVIEQLAVSDPRIKLVRSPKRAGVNTAIRRGVEASSSEYICFCGADDLVKTDFLEKSVHTLDDNPEAGFCFSDPTELLADSNTIREYPLYLNQTATCYTPDQIQRLLQLAHFTFSSNTILYRRAIWQASGGYIDYLEWYADWFANFIIASRHDVCYIPERLTVHRISKNSYSRMGVAQHAKNKNLVFMILEYLNSESRQDSYYFFRESALLPCYKFFILRSSMTSTHKDFISLSLVFRFLSQNLWASVRPILLPQLRRSARKFVSTLRI